MVGWVRLNRRPAAHRGAQDPRPSGAGAIPTRTCSPSDNRRARLSRTLSAPANGPPAADSASATRAPGAKSRCPHQADHADHNGHVGGGAAEVGGPGQRGGRNRVALEVVSPMTGCGSDRTSVKTVTSTATTARAPRASAPARPGSARTAVSQLVHCPARCRAATAAAATGRLPRHHRRHLDSAASPAPSCSPIRMVRTGKAAPQQARGVVRLACPDRRAARGRRRSPRVDMRDHGCGEGPNCANKRTRSPPRSAGASNVGSVVTIRSGGAQDRGSARSSRHGSCRIE